MRPLHIVTIAALVILIPAAAPSQTQSRTSRFEHEQMLWLLMARGISDEKVLAAMRNVPREDFVPMRLRRLAYADSPVSIGYDQVISQPYIVAVMTQLLGLKGGEKILEIGTGSGYQAAILAQITPNVYTIEIVEELANSARERLRKYGVEPSRVIQGDGYLGLPSIAPFDAIIVTAAPSHIPPPLLDQIKPGGRMVIPVGSGEVKELMVVDKDAEGIISKRTVLSVTFVPMTGKAHNRAQP